MEHEKNFSFVEHIDIKELEEKELLGKGSFGIVFRALWSTYKLDEATSSTSDVAVKLFYHSGGDIFTNLGHNSQKRCNSSFATELRQLSQMCHPNIVRLLGASTESPHIFIVMEYADGGSLYKVLHQIRPLMVYSSHHAMWWCLQCAEGIEYLHSRSIIHRDLKSPNLLLFKKGLIVKICDFGTACQVQTRMTNNRGSAAWMAPEVFESETYSEKCDVFSWSVCFWEVLARRIPFAEIGGNDLRILWAIHQGQRPPPLKGCPQAVVHLMNNCWLKISSERPSIEEVVKNMKGLVSHFPPSDSLYELDYPPSQTSPISDEYDVKLILNAVSPNGCLANIKQFTGDVNSTNESSRRFSGDEDGSSSVDNVIHQSNYNYTTHSDFETKQIDFFKLDELAPLDPSLTSNFSSANSEFDDVSLSTETIVHSSAEGAEKHDFYGVERTMIEKDRMVYPLSDYCPVLVDQKKAESDASQSTEDPYVESSTHDVNSTPRSFSKEILLNDTNDVIRKDEDKNTSNSMLTDTTSSPILSSACDDNNHDDLFKQQVFEDWPCSLMANLDNESEIVNLSISESGSTEVSVSENCKSKEVADLTKIVEKLQKTRSRTQQLTEIKADLLQKIKLQDELLSAKFEGEEPHILLSAVVEKEGDGELNGGAAADVSLKDMEQCLSLHEEKTRLERREAELIRKVQLATSNKM